jgi:hypothetical protein
MPVELNVRSELSRIIGELAQIHEASAQVGDGLSDAGKKIGDELNKKSKETETYLERLRSFGGRVADQLVKDFKALASVNALAGSLKFSEMFRGSIKETITLSDSVRKLAGTLGIAREEMSRFQNDATRALAKVGLSSESLSNSLGGLAETPVRGQKNLIAYAETAGELASVSRERGREADISRGLSKVVTARGGNPNDVSQMRAVADDVMRIRSATGKSASEILQAMESLFSGANKSFQGRLQGGGAVSLASAALFGGKDATGFLERYLHSNVFQRFGADAQGLGGIIGKNGALSLPAMESVLKTARGRGLGDEQAGLTTMGLSDEEAQGFIRLTAALRDNEATVEAARTKQVDLRKSYEESLEMGEAFNRVLGRTKSLMQVPSLAHGATDLLTKAGSSDVGAVATTVGAGVLAAVLTGAGLRGIGKAAGVEAATGRQVTPVFVTNFPSGFGAGGLGDLAKGAGVTGLLSTVGLIGAGVVVGGAAIAAGAANESRVADETLAPLKRFQERESANEKILQDINTSMKQQVQILSSPKSGRIEIDVRATTPNIKATPSPNRGASFGP